MPALRVAKMGLSDNRTFFRPGVLRTKILLLVFYGPMFLSENSLPVTVLALQLNKTARRLDTGHGEPHVALDLMPFLVKLGF